MDKKVYEPVSEGIVRHKRFKYIMKYKRFNRKKVSDDVKFYFTEEDLQNDITA